MLDINFGIKHMNQLPTITHITPTSLAVFFHAVGIADGEMHPDTLRFLESRTELLFEQPVPVNQDGDLREVEEVLAHLLAVELFVSYRQYFESAQFIEKVSVCVREFVKEARTIATTYQSYMPALSVISTAKPVFYMRNKIQEDAARKLLSGKITSQELAWIISITNLVSDGLLDLKFDYLEAPSSHLI